MILPSGRVPGAGLAPSAQSWWNYGRWLSDGHRARPVLALLHEFLRVYPVGLRTFDDLRRVLQKTVNGASSPPPSLQEWRKRCVDSELLRKGGDLSFLRKLVPATDSVEDILSQSGLDTGLARCGFLESGHPQVPPKPQHSADARQY